MSLKRPELVVRISDRLNELAAQLKSRSRAGLTDGNQILETISKRLFNELFGWNLENLNLAETNFPAADLGDHSRRLAFQITNEDSADKISRTAAKAQEHGLGADFDRLIILFLLPKKPGFPRQFPQPPNGPKIETWDIADVSKQLQDLDDLEALQRASKVLDEEMGRFFDTDAPSRPRNFILAFVIGGMVLVAIILITQHLRSNDTDEIGNPVGHLVPADDPFPPFGDFVPPGHSLAPGVVVFEIGGSNLVFIPPTNSIPVTAMIEADP